MEEKRIEVENILELGKLKLIFRNLKSQYFMTKNLIYREEI